MAVPVSSSKVKPAADPSQDIAAKMNALNQEMKRGNLNQENNMKKLMDTMKKDIILAGLGPVLKVLDVINKLIALLIMPFTNLIMPLLLPILYFLSPIVRFLNIALRPLFIQLMEWAKGQKGKVTAAAEQMKGGDITGAISSMVGIMGEGFQKLLSGIQPYLDGLLAAVGPAVQSLINMASSKIGDAIKFITDAVGGAGKGIQDWLTTNAPTIQKALTDTISGIGTLFNAFIGPIIAPVLSLVQSAVSGLTSGSGPIWGAKLDMDAIKMYADQLVNTDIPANIRTLFGTYIGPAIVGKESTLGVGLQSIADKAYSGLSEIGTKVAAAIIQATTVQHVLGMKQDFVQRPGQPPTSFSSGDTIVGFKNTPPNFGGGNAPQNITIRLVDSMNNTISSQRLQAGSGANMTFTV